jgi:hypothetical protein
MTPWTEEWLRENSTPEPNTGCWLWLGSNKGAYPGFGNSYVNREMLGLRSRRQHACHRCNQKMCVNPAHVYRGDSFTNMQDVVRDGKHHNAKKTRCPRGHVYDRKVWNGKYWARSCPCSGNPRLRKLLS